MAVKAGGKLGRYTLVERLGRGGMAEVWRAQSSGPGGFKRTVVVKRILPHLAEEPQFVNMFLAEARLSARLEHPNIVAVHELGQVGDEYFIAMEYVRGRDLVTVLRAHHPNGPPPPGMAAWVLGQIARGLAYAHSLAGDDGAPLRIIHRDVSPSNVMISFDGEVKLLDFGLAKALAESGDEQTRSGTLRGKFGYMSPEQILGLPVDHRVDVFAAGVVLWEALTARRLFKGETDVQSLALVRAAKVDPPSTVNPTVPPRLDWIALHALARDRDQRYQSCEEMARDLDAMAGELGWGQRRLADMMKELFAGRELSDAEAAWSVSIETLGNDLAGSQRSAFEARSKWLRLGLIAAGLCVAATAGVLGLRWAKGGPPSVRAQTVAVRVPAPVRSVAIEITSVPAGASLFLDGETAPRGTTPVWISLPRSPAARSLKLALAHHGDITTELVPDRDARILLTLNPLPPPTPVLSPPIAAPGKRRWPSRRARTTDLKAGDVVDPFRK